MVQSMMFWKRVSAKEERIFGEFTILLNIQLNVNLSGQLRDISGVSEVGVIPIRQ